jgi:hypothetical protein
MEAWYVYEDLSTALRGRREFDEGKADSKGLVMNGGGNFYF